MSAIEGSAQYQERFIPRYDLTAEEGRALVAEYLEKSDLPEGRFVGIVAGPEEDIANVARTQECAVFQEAYPKNNADWMSSTYGKYEGDSRFLIVLDREDSQVAGVMRLVTDAPHITLEDAPEYIGHSQESIFAYHGIQPEDKIWDAATLAVPLQYRGRSMVRQGMAINGMLYRMFVLLGQRENVQHTVAMIDSKAYSALTNVGIPFEAMHGHTDAFEYYDSPKTLAVYNQFDKFLPGVARHYEDYRFSVRRLADTMRFIAGARRGEKGRAALKRLGTARVAGMIATGRIVDRHIALPV